MHLYASSGAVACPAVARCRLAEYRVALNVITHYMRSLRILYLVLLLCYLYGTIFVVSNLLFRTVVWFGCAPTPGRRVGPKCDQTRLARDTNFLA